LKKKTASRKLQSVKNIIARLNDENKQMVKGGMKAHTHSVCGEQCCDTDQFTNCMSRPEFVGSG